MRPGPAIGLALGSRVKRGELVTKSASHIQSVGRAITEALFADNTTRARELICAELNKRPDDHWLLTRLALAYYEERRYKLALRYNKRALSVAPYCPLVLFDYACTLDMLGREREAIAVWKRLLRKGEAIIDQPCSEGPRAMRGLLNDCRYRIALSYHDLGRESLARRYLDEHLRHRASNVSGEYTLRDVKKTQRKWSRGRPK